MEEATEEATLEQHTTCRRLAAEKKRENAGYPGAVEGGRLKFLRVTPTA